MASLFWREGKPLHRIHRTILVVPLPHAGRAPSWLACLGKCDSHCTVVIPPKRPKTRALASRVPRATNVHPSASGWGQFCGPLLPIVLPQIVFIISSCVAQSFALLFRRANDREMGPLNSAARAFLGIHWLIITVLSHVSSSQPNRTVYLPFSQRDVPPGPPLSHLSLRLCRIATGAGPTVPRDYRDVPI